MGKDVPFDPLTYHIKKSEILSTSVPSSLTQIPNPVGQLLQTVNETIIKTFLGYSTTLGFLKYLALNIFTFDVIRRTEDNLTEFSII